MFLSGSSTSAPQHDGLVCTTDHDDGAITTTERSRRLRTFSPRPFAGPGSAALSTLVSRWAALDADEYPGAGFGTLTPDGRLDPLLTYAYDAVFVLAAAIESVQTTAAEWGGFFEGFIAERCERLRLPPQHKIDAAGCRHGRFLIFINISGHDD